MKILPREALKGNNDRMLLRETWAGIIDTVGGEILASAIKATNYGGAVTCCGNVAGPEINLNVYPFILRAVTLIGVDSANCAMVVRTSLWQKLAGAWKIPSLNELCKEISLADLDQHIDLVLQGKHRGRIIIDLWN